MEFVFEELTNSVRAACRLQVRERDMEVDAILAMATITGSRRKFKD